ncbi:MAG TPA: 30S ribosomal protein S6 [Gemmatimonadaceae bacterium]
MTRPYEAVYVFDSTLEDAAITEKLTRFQELLGNPADLAVDLWGRRQLAYHIGRKDTGYYVVARFSAEPSVLPEFERALKLDDGVLRYLISLHENETGAPPMSEEELAAAARRQNDDDDDED